MPQLVAVGLSAVEVGDELHVSERPAKRMTASLLRKLRMANRTEAAALAGHAGLLGA
ncbi:LuxR C-terminal-related transcriptional regulator [Micromonospora echinospora]|uniref:LuxR C-terminal-related transcriptional regulator n=1 Tax=Micromonospora echinospora TaxID=1877 RepID=UPI0022AB12D6|nr:LuxR C-terminal-related transcriptional regulator [Micromonospora echinospora]